MRLLRSPQQVALQDATWLQGLRQNELEDARALQVLASTWHHQLCSHKGGREEKSPAVCVERRHHGKNAGGTCHARSIWH